MIIKDASLTKPQLDIIRHQGTEPPNSGTYTHTKSNGTYVCRACGQALFRANTQFHATCGWPSFDEAIPNTVAETTDDDGHRTEITCAHCHAHLGHVFDGEGFTKRNRRFCVNSRSLDLVNRSDLIETEEAIIAAGCFWGVQYYFDRLPGVAQTEVGYTGGRTPHPTYNDVCTGTTGHFEAVRVLYNPRECTYETVLKHFFEIHDPTQANGQGPDRGTQYQSAIFYYNDEQKQLAEKLKQTLTQNNLTVATHILPVSPFWPAEMDHQHYYNKNKHTPYCHSYTKRF